MRLVLQRVSSASVSVNGGERERTGKGLVILTGICAGDDEKTAGFMAEKAVNLRIFEDGNGAMNLSLLDISGDCLVIPNFTLYADSRKGRRPSFINAAPPDFAEPMYACFVKALETSGVKRVQNGMFGADMQVEINNDGPVTIILDSEKIMSAGRTRGGEQI